MRNKNMLTHKQVHSNVIYQFSSIQSLSYVQLFVTPWTATCQPSLSITNSQSLLVFLSIEPSNHLIFCHPFFCLQSWPASGSFPMNQFFASGGQSIGVSVSASVLPMNIQDWFPLGWLVQSPCSPRDSQESSPTPQFKSINSTAFFIVQLSYPYLTTGKNIALTRWTFVGKVMSQLFNMLSRLVIAFLSRNKHLLISWLQLPSAVILEPKKIVCPCFHCYL